MRRVTSSTSGMSGGTWSIASPGPAPVGCPSVRACTEKKESVTFERESSVLHESVAFERESSALQESVTFERESSVLTTYWSESTTSSR